MTRTVAAHAYAVDSQRCIGCAACAVLAPGVFQVRNRVCQVLRTPREPERSSCRAAIINCPTQAIRLDGRDVEARESESASADWADLFAELMVHAESARWALADVPWSDLRPDAATSELRVLVREMAFSEHATYSATQRFLQAFYDDVALSQWIAVWFYEESRHPHILMEWLRKVGEQLDDDFVKRARVSSPFMKSKMGTLVTNVISEVTAALAYDALARNSLEPVLATIARRISGDEARHASSFYRFARARIETSDRPDRERLDGLKVLHFWTSGRDQVSHPVNQMLQRLVPDGAEVNIPGFDLAKLEARVTRLVGLLLDLDLSRPPDVEGALRDLVARVHQAV
jgi:ferredoxin